MSASRFALAGLALGTIVLGLLPAAGPLSPVEQRPISGPGQPGQGTFAWHPRAAANEGLLHCAAVEPVKGEPNGACRAGDLRHVPAATSPEREATGDPRTAPGQPGEEPTGRLPLAESRLVQMLAAWRESSRGEASRTRGVLRQPCLDELAGLVPLAGPDELGKLVSYQSYPDPARPQPASTQERNLRPMPGLIIPVSYDSAPAGPRGDLGGASDTAASVLPREDHATTMPEPAPLTRCRATVKDWIARRFRRVAGQSALPSGPGPVPRPGDLPQP